MKNFSDEQKIAIDQNLLKIIPFRLVINMPAITLREKITSGFNLSLISIISKLKEYPKLSY